MRSRRGVTLIEGMVATMILLIGMVGIFQGMVIASTQNASANKRTRASAIANELVGAVDQYGRRQMLNLAGYVPAGVDKPANSNVLSTAQKAALAADLSGRLFFPDSEIVGELAANELQRRTPGFTVEDDKTFQRLVAISGDQNSPMVTVVVRVAWNEAGNVKTVTRTTAFYNSSANLTGIEY